MSGLPRSIIKKYGVSKKAWSVYRKSRLPKKKVIKKGRTQNMVRRKSRRTVYKYKPKRSRSRRAAGFSIFKELMPIGVTVFTEPFVDTAVDRFAGQFNAALPFGLQVDDLAKMIVGGHFAKKSGMVGKIAKYYAIFGARNTLKNVLGGVMTQTAPQTTSSVSF